MEKFTYYTVTVQRLRNVFTGNQWNPDFRTELIKEWVKHFNSLDNAEKELERMMKQRAMLFEWNEEKLTLPILKKFKYKPREYDWFCEAMLEEHNITFSDTKANDEKTSN